jgi:hypothetical protein
MKHQAGESPRNYPSPSLLFLGVVIGLFAIVAVYSSTMWHPLLGKDGNPILMVTQHTITTAWAAILVTTPALCTFWFRQRSIAATHYWLTSWTIGCMVFLVHFFQATVVFFKNDWSKILNSPDLVSMPLFDTFLTVWWILDVTFAWVGVADKRFVFYQRSVLHVLVLAVFLMGTLKEGKYTASIVVGLLLGVPALSAIGLRLNRYRLKRLTPITPSTKEASAILKTEETYFS